MWTLYYLSAIRFIDGHDVSALRTFEFNVHCHTYLHPMPPLEKFRA
jgi:hypothetical protein